MKLLCLIKGHDVIYIDRYIPCRNNRRVSARCPRCGILVRDALPKGIRA